MRKRKANSSTDLLTVTWWYCVKSHTTPLVVENSLIDFAPICPWKIHEIVTWIFLKFSEAFDTAMTWDNSTEASYLFDWLHYHNKNESRNHSEIKAVRKTSNSLCRLVNAAFRLRSALVSNAEKDAPTHAKEGITRSHIASWERTRYKHRGRQCDYWRGRVLPTMKKIREIAAPSY
jgi:hypothetical protein